MVKPAPNTPTIARNSLWYGIEVAVATVALLGISIPTARVLGPEAIGYFNYIGWLASITGILGTAGIPVMTRKYIAEYLGRGEPGIARAVYTSALRLQFIVASVITAGAVALLWMSGDPAHRAVSTMQILSVFPAMIGLMPAQVNAAREELRANVIPSIVGTAIQLTSVIISLWVGWNLMGIAAGMLISRLIEFIVRGIPVQRWILSLPAAEIPPELKTKMRTFSGQSLIMLLVQSLVWDKSDIFLLKLQSADIAQVTFFTIGFNLTDKVLLVPHVFAGALSTTMMAQYGRDKARLNSLVSEAGKYMFLVACPLLLGMAALSPAVIRTLYGQQYLPAIPVLAISAIALIPKALFAPVQTFLQANERQGFLLIWTGFSGVLNVVADLLLIPHLGARGAAIGNGIGQLTAVLGIWIAVIRWYGLRIDTASLLKMAAAAVGMAALVATLSRLLPPIPALLLGVAVGAAFFLTALRYFKALTAGDRSRILSMQQGLPAPVRPFMQRAAAFLAPGVD